MSAITSTSPSAADLDAIAAQEQARQATLVPPTPDQIDTLISQYEFAQNEVRLSQKVADQLKAELITMVETFGQIPPTATASRRLEGRHSEAVVTTAVSTSVNEAAVHEFAEFLASKGILGLFSRFFAVQTKHTIVDGARDVLKTLTMSSRVQEKILQLFGRAIEVKTKAPSLKVTVIKPEKPARTPRGGKAAA